MAEKQDGEITDQPRYRMPASHGGLLVSVQTRGGATMPTPAVQAAVHLVQQQQHKEEEEEQYSEATGEDGDPGEWRGGGAGRWRSRSRV